MERGAWRATVHGVPKSQTRLSEHADKLTSCDMKQSSVLGMMRTNQALSLVLRAQFRLPTC